jgi:hypothetical protein
MARIKEYFSDGRRRMRVFMSSELESLAGAPSLDHPILLGEVLLGWVIRGLRQTGR